VNISRLVFKEIAHRRGNFALGLLAVALATGCLSGAISLIEARRAGLAMTMAKLEDDMRKAMLNLGFNIVILPKNQRLEDWYIQDFGTQYMPEDYGQRLKQAKVVTVQHLLPILQQRVKWPEVKRTIILAGTRGEVPGTGQKKAMVEAVGPDVIVLGYQLHQDLGYKVGQKIELMGQSFTVQQCYPMRGNTDDITAWVNLAVAQKLLDKPGQINAILALECECALANLGKVRQEIEKILPDTQLVERGSEALARAEARRKAGQQAKAAIENEEALAGVLVTLVTLVCAGWVAVLMLGNVRQRQSEIGILRAIGVGSGKVMRLFLAKGAVLGLAGGAVGFVAGYAAVVAVEHFSAAPAEPAFPWWAMLLTLAGAPLLAMAASWPPAMLAARQDAAGMLRDT
jgi:putative ABC transport system permease protein